MVERYRLTSNTRPSAGIGDCSGSITRTVSSSAESAFLVRRELQFLLTGSTLLNCMFGGGWPFGRTVNIVGDKSTGKTLLAEEAMAIFCRDFPQAKKPKYRETEAAFDVSYFEALGGDQSKVDFGPDGPDTQWQTIESITADIKATLDQFEDDVAAKVAVIRKRRKRVAASIIEAEVVKAMPPMLYIIDSLDGLTSEAELARKAEDGSYNLEKQKLLGALFRKEIRRMKRAKMLFMVISQIRERIGAMIRGQKYTRTGGKALDFYASIVVFLADLGKVYETHKSVKRVVAVKIKAKTTKNKVVAPFRECVFELRFGYGIDDEWACLDFLKEVNRLKDAGFTNKEGKGALPPSLEGVDLNKLRTETTRIWMDIEKAFLPEKGKYAS